MSEKTDVRLQSVDVGGRLTTLEHSLLLRLGDQDDALRAMGTTIRDLETKLAVMTQKCQEFESRAYAAEAALDIIPGSDTNG